VGHHPSAEDRVAIVYDLLVTGEGIREVVDDLRATYGVHATAAVVLMSYDARRELEGGDSGTIRVEALEWYGEVAGALEDTLNPGRRLEGQTDRAAGQQSRVDPPVLTGVVSTPLSREEPPRTDPEPRQGGRQTVDKPGGGGRGDVKRDWSESDPTILGWETSAEAQRAVQESLDRHDLRRMMEAATVPFTRGPDALYPVRRCSACRGGRLHAYGQHRLEDGRVMGHIVICDACGHYDSRARW
jgi:hypothetical protein